MGAFSIIIVLYRSIRFYEKASRVVIYNIEDEYEDFESLDNVVKPSIMYVAVICGRVSSLSLVLRNIIIVDVREIRKHKL